MRVLVCGSRKHKDREVALAYLDRLHETRGPISLIIEGGASGADYWARLWAETRGIPLMVMLPAWLKFGKAAGPIRNGWMLEYGKPDLVVAFLWPPDKSGGDGEPGGGTGDMIAQAQKAGVEVERVA